jgi:signal transduction histidine kinase
MDQPKSKRRARVARPITKQVQVPEFAIERLMQTNRLLLIARLSAPAAHEIINPVAAVLNLTALMQHILQDDGIPKDRVQDFRSYLSQAISESRQAGRIASEMLAFASASKRESRLTDLNETVRQALSLAAHMFKVGDVGTTVDLDPDLPAVRCDSVAIQHALLNILVNAAEAVEGGASRRVAIRTLRQHEGAKAVIEITDTGKGIPLELLPKIFDPFFTTRQKPGNLGLGMTIARRILETHLGSLEVASLPERGTTVKVILPAADGGDRS